MLILPPRSSRDSFEPERQTAPLPGEKSTSERWILVVDDSAADLELTSLALREVGWKGPVELAMDGEQAQIGRAHV